MVLGVMDVVNGLQLINLRSLIQTISMMELSIFLPMISNLLSIQSILIINMIIGPTLIMK